MKANEIRIGNLFNVIDRSGEVHLPNPTVFKIVSIDTFYVSAIKEKDHLPNVLYTFNIDIKDVSPIPLTKEWLLKFGFVKWRGWLILDAFSPGHPSQRFDLYWSDVNGFMTKSRYQGDNDDFKMRHIKHVHQLQNLYFTLTGEELKPFVTNPIPQAYKA